MYMRKKVDYSFLWFQLKASGQQKMTHLTDGAVNNPTKTSLTITIGWAGGISTIKIKT